MSPSSPSDSGIRDNHTCGPIGDFLREQIQSGSQLAIVSASFTIDAFQALQDHLASIDDLHCLFGEPRFVAAHDFEQTDKKAFQIEDDGPALQNRLQQKPTAKACAACAPKCRFAPSSRPTCCMARCIIVRVLGLSPTGHNNIELNLIVDGNRDRRDLKVWFDARWSDERLVEEVR
jgi:hypothetical protein